MRKRLLAAAVVVVAVAALAAAAAVWHKAAARVENTAQVGGPPEQETPESATRAPGKGPSELGEAAKAVLDEVQRTLAVLAGSADRDARAAPSALFEGEKP